MEASFLSSAAHLEDRMLSGIHCLVIDSSQLFCEATATLLVNRADSLLDVSRASPNQALIVIAESNPDIALIGPNIDPQEGLELVWQIKEEFPTVQLIAIGLAPQEDRILELIEAGVADYLLQHQSADDLLRTIVAVSQGRSFCSGRILSRVFTRISELSQTYGRKPACGVAPTSREKEILALLARGFSNKEIAHTLGIAPATVKNHVHKILGKLRVDNREEAVRHCFQTGLLKNV